MADAYEALPYAGRAYARTHPDRLGLVGALHGVGTADPSGARVLEIGCAAGDNLLPIALQYPGATCVGVDLAQVHVDRARQAIDALGLDNATVQQGSFADLDASHGPFDYVIAHGVWSWVSPELQERLFAVCRELLAPGGVAYVSYNALPGQHLDQWLRTVMKHHVRDLPPAEAVEEARAFLGLVGTTLDHRGALLEAGLLRAAAAEARTLHDAFFFHDYLGDEHHPARVADFVARARARGLEYLGDADSWGPLGEDLPEPARELLDGLDDRIEVEQYLDLLTNRSFRRTLLVRADEAVGPLDPRALHGLHLGCDGTVHDGDPPRLEVDDQVLTVREADLEAVLRRLVGRWPRTLDFATLAEAGGGDPDDLAERLLALAVRGLVELRRSPAPAQRVTDRPRLFAWARYQMERGDDEYTTARHAQVELDNSVALTLSLCDGERHLEDIAAALLRTVEAATDGQADVGRLEAQALAAQALEIGAHASLLVP